MAKVKILGEELDIRFCMAVELAYEEISGEAFSLDGLKSARNRMALMMAAVLVSSPGTAITAERLLREATGPETAALQGAVLESMTRWLEIPAVAAAAGPEAPEDGSPN